MFLGKWCRLLNERGYIYGSNGFMDVGSRMFGAKR